MANFDSGVKRYIKGYAVVKVGFPVDFRDAADISCRQCEYLSSNERMCQLNKCPTAFPQRYVGNDCPLLTLDEFKEYIKEFIESEEKENEKIQ